ncbi:uncharacterized protein V3H82_022300 [Fundulus diaphanus]
MCQDAACRLQSEPRCLSPSPAQNNWFHLSGCNQPSTALTWFHPYLYSPQSVLARRSVVFFSLLSLCQNPVSAQFSCFAPSEAFTSVLFQPASTLDTLLFLLKFSSPVHISWVPFCSSSATIPRSHVLQQFHGLKFSSTVSSSAAVPRSQVQFHGLKLCSSSTVSIPRSQVQFHGLTFCSSSTVSSSVPRSHVLQHSSTVSSSAAVPRSQVPQQFHGLKFRSSSTVSSSAAVPRSPVPQLFHGLKSSAPEFPPGQSPHTPPVSQLLHPSSPSIKDSGSSRHSPSILFNKLTLRTSSVCACCVRVHPKTNHDIILPVPSLCLSAWSPVSWNPYPLDCLLVYRIWKAPFGLTAFQPLNGSSLAHLRTDPALREAKFPNEREPQTLRANACVSCF